MLFLLQTAIQEPQRLTGQACDICVSILKMAEEFISDPTNEKEIEAFLDKVCQTLPKDFAAWCESILVDHLQEIIDAIINQFPPEVACKDIGLCA